MKLHDKRQYGNYPQVIYRIENIQIISNIYENFNINLLFLYLTLFLRTRSLRLPALPVVAL